MRLFDSPSYSWLGELDLGFDLRDDKTVMSRNRHEGPLVVQKALYPEGPQICQVLIIHPPGGIAGGDELRINCDVEKGACVQLINPGATKWYESFERPSKQLISLNLKADSICEWLPQENIIFNKYLFRNFFIHSLSGGNNTRVSIWYTNIFQNRLNISIFSILTM